MTSVKPYLLPNSFLTMYNFSDVVTSRYVLPMSVAQISILFSSARNSIRFNPHSKITPEYTLSIGTSFRHPSATYLDSCLQSCLIWNINWTIVFLYSGGGLLRLHSYEKHRIHQGGSFLTW